MNALVPLPVILPLLGAGLTLILSRRPRLQRAVSTTVLGVVVAVAEPSSSRPTAMDRR
jgi:multicomponent Na+:H+ antiporter subunit D